MADRERNVSIITDCDQNRIVLINDIRFKAKAWEEWEDVKELLKEYVGCEYVITDTEETIFIGEDFPDEYVGSEYTAGLWRNKLKAKANAGQAIPELISIAKSPSYEKNKKEKHESKAKLGWYKYPTKFAIPKYDRDTGEISSSAIFAAELLVRHDEDGIKYLYDLVNIKNGQNPI